MLTKRNLIAGLLAITLLAPQLQGQDTAPKPSYTLIKNVKIFDGVNDRLKPGHVLIENNLIKQVGDIKTFPKGTTIIDGGGRTLMPGLIDSHSHFNLTGLVQTPAALQAAKWDQVGPIAAENARDYLYDGYTTVRDAGGMGGALGELIDRGILQGPRIYASGAFIGPSSGHGDFRNPSSRVPGGQPPLSRTLGISYVSDTKAEIRKAARLNFSHGATQLKLMAGGGLASQLDPLWSVAYSVDEMKVAVEAAKFFDTYVLVHAYTDEQVNIALDAGVKCIDHGQMVSEKTVKRMVDEGIFWSINVAAMDPALLNHPNFSSPAVKPKVLSFQEGSKRMWDLIKKHKPKVVHNIDTVLSTIEFGRSSRDFEKFYFAKGLGNHAMLVSATSTAGELAQLTGKRNPYPHKLGVIEAGAYADILIVDGNPLEDLSVLGANPKWFDAKPRKQGLKTIRLIMKDGKVYKNTLK